MSETIELYEFKNNGRYVDNLTELVYVNDDNAYIEIVCMGNEEIPENVINSWRNRKNNYSRLKNAELRVLQGGKDDSEEKFNYISELYESKKAELLTKDERIRVLEEEIANLSKNAALQIPFQDISAEARANYENLSALGFSYRIQTDFNKLDTIPLFEVKWKDGISADQVQKEEAKLTNWLKIRLQNNKIQVKTVND